ncbi:MAG TPA: DEAD/DEAH box helicase [Mucilaginibacter sp.]
MARGLIFTVNYIGPGLGGGVITAVQQQAIDSNYRIGQVKMAFAYKMICRDTIEEKILHLLEREKHLSDIMIGG